MKIRIVGSMKFYNEFVEAQNSLESKGHLVRLPEDDPVPGQGVTKEQKLRFMEVFNEDLKWADAIVVMNYPKAGKENHIGVNTIMEIGMAFILEKQIFLLFPPPDHCKDELGAIPLTVLHGKVEYV